MERRKKKQFHCDFLFILLHQRAMPMKIVFQKGVSSLNSVWNSTSLNDIFNYILNVVEHHASHHFILFDFHCYLVWWVLFSHFHYSKETKISEKVLQSIDIFPDKKITIVISILLQCWIFAILFYFDNVMWCDVLFLRNLFTIRIWVSHPANKGMQFRFLSCLWRNVYLL